MRANNNQYRAAQSVDAQKRADILADSRMLDAEKKRLLEPIERTMRARYSTFEQTRDEHLAAELVQHADAQPRATLTRVAFAHPAHAAAMLQIFAAASAAEKMAFTKLAVAENDVTAVYAMHRALANDAAVTDDERFALGAHLAAVTAPTARQADAELFALRAEAARLESMGWDLDETANSDRALEHANENSALPREDGALHVLTGREQSDLLALAGVPAAGT